MSVFPQNTYLNMSVFIVEKCVIIYTSTFKGDLLEDEDVGFYRRTIRGIS